MLSVRVCDLITLLIIAKGGHCIVVYVPETVQNGLKYMFAKYHVF